MKYDKERKEVIKNRLKSTRYGFFTDIQKDFEQCAKCGINDKEKTVDFGKIYINRSWTFKEYTVCTGCMEEIRKLFGDKPY